MPKAQDVEHIFELIFEKIPGFKNKKVSDDKDGLYPIKAK